MSKRLGRSKYWVTLSPNNPHIRYHESDRHRAWCKVCPVARLVGKREEKRMDRELTEVNP
jgi:hypothetical protein